MEEELVPTAITDTQLDAVLDAFSEKASVQYVARKTQLPVKQVRELFSNRAIINKAFERKATVSAVWLVGEGFDVLRDIITEGSHRNRIDALRLLQSFLTSLPQSTVFSEPQEEKVVSKPVLVPEVVVEKDLEEIVLELSNEG